VTVTLAGLQTCKEATASVASPWRKGQAAVSQGKLYRLWAHDGVYFGKAPTDLVGSLAPNTFPVFA
jgi:hypothetical protein